MLGVVDIALEEICDSFLFIQTFTFIILPQIIINFSLFSNFMAFQIIHLYQFLFRQQSLLHRINQFIDITKTQPLLISWSQMLKQEKFMGYSKSESSIRHQVRKLRAKVKALIPEEVCEHFEKRNQRVQKINMLRAKHLNNQIKKNNLNSPWTASKQKIQTYHVSEIKQETNCRNKKFYQFDRLKPEEIEQVNEDKNYYLGQNNVQAYNDYIKHIKSSIHTNPYEHKESAKKSAVFLNNWNNERLSSRANSLIMASMQTHQSFDRNKTAEKTIVHRDHLNGKNFTTYSNNGFNKDKDLVRTRNTVADSYKWGTAHEIKKNIFNQNVDEKTWSNVNSLSKLKSGRKTAGEVKEWVEQEQRQRIMYKKLKQQMQMSKAESNQREAKYRKYFKLRQRAGEQQQKYEKVVKKKKMLQKKGEIAKIDEQLRQIIIERRKKQGNRSNSCINLQQFNVI